MNPEPQYLCSHLITVLESGRRWVANLEKIWASGATVNAESSIDCGTELHLPDLGATARVVFAEADQFGYYLDLEFLPPYRWSVDAFRPEHLTDPNLISANPKSRIE